MSTIDIRSATEVDTVIFTDKGNGTGKAYKITKFVPEQFSLHTVGGEQVPIKRADIDNLIKALEYAKVNWGAK